MDKVLLNDFFPSLLIFASIGFTLLISIPRLRCWIKAELEKKITFGDVPASEFFSLTYFLNITKGLDIIGIAYLVSVTLILFVPIFSELMEITYYYIIVITVTLLVYIVGSIYPAIRKTLASAKIFPIKNIPASNR